MDIRRRKEGDENKLGEDRMEQGDTELYHNKFCAMTQPLKLKSNISLLLRQREEYFNYTTWFNYAEFASYVSSCCVPKCSCFFYFYASTAGLELNRIPGLPENTSGKQWRINGLILFLRNREWGDSRYWTGQGCWSMKKRRACVFYLASVILIFPTHKASDTGAVRSVSL